MKDLLLRARVVVKTSKMIPRRHLADYVKNCTKKRAARAARLFFLIQPIQKHHSFGGLSLLLLLLSPFLKPPDAGA